MKIFPPNNDHRGIAAFEFALVLPILLLLLLAGTDMTIWFISKFRLDNTASTVGSIVSSAETLSDPTFPAPTKII